MGGDRGRLFVVLHKISIKSPVGAVTAAIVAEHPREKAK
jgi:hypothetical protein